MILEILLGVSESGCTVDSTCTGFEEPGSTMGPQKVSSIKWLSINMDKGEARKWDRGLWCSSVMECLPRIMKALNSLRNATRRKGGGNEKRKKEQGMLHQTWACRIRRRHWS